MSATRESGISALNQQFATYDQVDKPQTYRLAEGNDDQFDHEYHVRTCDIGQFLRGNRTDKERFAEELGLALQEIGFAILVGHGVDPRLYVEATEKVIEHFTTPTLAQKMRFRAKRVGSVSQGYFPLKRTGEIHPDLVEGWVFCRRAFDLAGRRDGRFRPKSFWPLPELEPFFRTIVLEHEKLILPITQSIFTYLGCDPHYYNERLTEPNFGLRLNYYPPVTAEDDASGAGRLLGHEDTDLFTLLPAPSVEGLQALNRKNFRWVRLNAPAGSIILNTGDYMQRITNDVIPSARHRVSKPQDPSLQREPRVSIPMAVYVWEDELLEVLPGLPTPKYDPIKAITFHTRTKREFAGDGYAVESI